MNLRYSIDPADTDGGMAAAAIEQESTDFTTAARAAGRVVADEWMQKNGGPQTTGHHIAHTSIIYGFRAGAEWAGAQEPTDAEVEAAAEAAFLSTGPSIANGMTSDWADADEYQRDRWRTRARAALTAARKAQGR